MEEFGIERLPQDCIARVISLTTPRDACRSAAVSSVFCSAAVSDTVWERFLPPDYQSLLDRSADPIDPSSSKHDLFFCLCDWVLLDGGRMGVRLEKSSGAKCFMLSARMLTIIWSDTPAYWRWIPVADSRFSEAAELIHVCWLEIRGKIQSNMLTRNTTYAAFLVYKLTNRSQGLRYAPQEASVALGLQSSTSIVRVQPNYTFHRALLNGDRYMVGGDLAADVDDVVVVDDENDDDSDAEDGVAMPRIRDDGWMEISLGEFYYEEGKDGEVAMSFTEVKWLHWKSGLIVLGIEIRPKI